MFYFSSEKKRKGKFIRFKDIETEEQLEEVIGQFFNITSHSPKEEIETAMEIMSIHMFSIIVGNLRKFDHNLFKALSREDESTGGPFIYIDNDRSQWKTKARKLGELKKGLNPMSKICKFPKYLSERILLLRTKNPNNGGLSLGSSLHSISEKIYGKLKNGPLFTKDEGSVIDNNIDFIASMIDNCVVMYGFENVLIEEPWPQPHNYERIGKALYKITGKL